MDDPILKGAGDALRIALQCNTDLDDLFVHALRKLDQIGSIERVSDDAREQGAPGTPSFPGSSIALKS
ncbi:MULTISPECIES: hypothetical protein [unclassified Chelatococcus]|uniref:hypothetical protein n=1 Tax=unclassified Chelatococcus TaxID=2638111 RepID=UPI001BCF3F0D|nr:MULTISPECIES: hypothetical protein [unclassified Chelatococcus]MBS7698667.1 hypothetical protein [Chelatococcus sp. YT9]MBX3554751.1 hypothetical protein [Chelatococcus sp.]